MQLLMLLHLLSPTPYGRSDGTALHTDVPHSLHQGFDLLDPSHDTKKLEDLPKVALMEDEDGNIHLRQALPRAMNVTVAFLKLPTFTASHHCAICPDPCTLYTAAYRGKPPDLAAPHCCTKRCRRLRNLSVYLAANEEEALNYLFLGDTNRAISETAMNKASSRSHCIFTVRGGNNSGRGGVT